MRIELNLNDSVVKACNDLTAATTFESNRTRNAVQSAMQRVFASMLAEQVRQVAFGTAADIRYAYDNSPASLGTLDTHAPECQKIQRNGIPLK